MGESKTWSLRPFSARVADSKKESTLVEVGYVSRESL